MLAVAPASVSGMVRRLSEVYPPMVEYQKHHGVRLTAVGRSRALEVIRHHRLIELFLHTALGYSWDEVHAEAEKLEHCISETLEDRIAAALGDPEFDPHGHPIPRRDGSLPNRTDQSLAQVKAGTGSSRVKGIRPRLGNAAVSFGNRSQARSTHPVGGAWSIRWPLDDPRRRITEPARVRTSHCGGDPGSSPRRGRHMTTVAWLLGLVLGAVALVAPRFGLVPLWWKFRASRERARSEDALKHILAWKHRSKLASLESLAGSLRLSAPATLRLATRMELAGWIRSRSAGIALTPSGERLALQVVRAHRLWERHLSDDANMPMARLHQAAENAEHTLTRDQVERLDAHLGHPQHDPHGDPIPAADGRMASIDAVSLTEWPVGEPALIAHIEDEPDPVFQQVLAAGLRPAQVVKVLTTGPERLVVAVEGAERRIDPAVAANVQVAAAREEDLPPPDAIRLSDLPLGGCGEVVELGPACVGFSRRRLLDLGLTPGAQVEVSLETAFGDPRAFRIRGTTVALRGQQAEQILVRPLLKPSGTGVPL